MKGIALISFQGGGVVLPARTPYEREVLFDHVRQCVNRHGRVRLAFNRREWMVRLMSEPPRTCTTCAHPIDNLIYEYNGRDLCGHCVSRAMR
jgi:hypothetical protein